MPADQIQSRNSQGLLAPAGCHFSNAWDLEPADRVVASWTAPVLWRLRLARLHSQSNKRLALQKPSGVPAVHGKRSRARVSDAQKDFPAIQLKQNQPKGQQDRC